MFATPDRYILPVSWNEAYHLTGDGVAVPVARHIARHVIEPILDRRRKGFSTKPATTWKLRLERICRVEYESATNDGTS